MAISSDLEHLLVRWLPRQRWMPALGTPAGAEPDVTPQSVVRIAEVSDGDTGTVQCLLVVLTVRGPLRHTRLCVPLAVRTTEDFSLRPHLVGTVDDLLLGKTYVYDGAADPVFVLALADAIADARSGSGEEFQCSLAGDELPLADTQRTSVPRGERTPSDQRTHEEYGVALLTRAREHRFRRTEGLGSESRVEIDGPDGTYALTILREIGSDNPPAVRYPLALTAVESPTVHPVIGWSQTRWYDDADLTTITAPFALLAHALPGSRRAWRSAAEKVLVVDSGSVGSFNRQASVLGSVVGRLHVGLASEFGRVRSEGDPTRRLVRKWRERVDWALNRAPGALSALEGRLRAHADALDGLDSIGQLQRIHGELTLDHITVGTAEGPRIIGFGVAHDEPRPVEIDLVAMVRSIDYAAGYAWLQRSEALTGEESRFRALATRGLDDDLRDDYLGAPEHLWYRQTANSLLSGYSHARGETAALVDPVLRAALIDRLLVEVVSEMRNRPAWLLVPLAALVETLGAGEVGESAIQDAVPGDGSTPDDHDSLRVDAADGSSEDGEIAAGADVLPDRAVIDDDRARHSAAVEVQSSGSTPADDAESSVEVVTESEDAAELAVETSGQTTEEAPAEDVGEEAPTGGAAEEDSADEAPGEAPAEDVAGEDPAGEAPGEAPAEEVAGEDPADVAPGEVPEGTDAAEAPATVAGDLDPSTGPAEVTSVGETETAVPQDSSESDDAPAGDVPAGDTPVSPLNPPIPAKPAWSPAAVRGAGGGHGLDAPLSAGDATRDSGGIDDAGLDEDGLDEDGLDEDGLDEDGLDEDGLDEDGLDEDGAGDDEPDVGTPPRSARASRGSAD